MHNIAVLKTAYDMHDGIDFTDMRQELVSKPLAAVCAPDKACDINKFDGCRHEALGMIHFVKHFQPVVGYVDYADIGLYGAEGVVCRLRSCLGDSVEQGAFTHVWKADNSKLHIKRNPPLKFLSTFHYII